MAPLGYVAVSGVEYDTESKPAATVTATDTDAAAPAPSASPEQCFVVGMPPHLHPQCQYRTVHRGKSTPLPPPAPAQPVAGGGPPISQRCHASTRVFPPFPPSPPRPPIVGIPPPMASKCQLRAAHRCPCPRHAPLNPLYTHQQPSMLT